MHELKVARSQALTTREMAQIGLFTALIAAGAYIKINIPVQPFPMHFTMQFLFVLLAGFLLGARRGAICVGIYLAVGLSGIPVFAAGGGPAYLIRPTFGFFWQKGSGRWQEICSRIRNWFQRKCYIINAGVKQLERI